MNRTPRATVAALSLTVGLVLVLTACGRGGDEAAPTTPSEAPAVSEGPATGSLTVWAMGTEGEALGEFSEAFKADNPDVTIDVTPIPWDAAHDKIATAIAAQETPDIALIGTTWMGEFAATGALDATPDVVDPASFFEGAWESTVVDGTSYGVPWYVETRVLYQNGDLAEKAGVSAPADWAALTDQATKMKAAGATYGLNLQPGETGAWQTFMPFAWQAGAQIVSDTGELTLDTPEMVEALTFYQSFFTEGLSPTDLPQGTLESDFVSGKIGAFVSGPWHIGLLRDAGGEEFLDDVILSPLPAGTQQASFIGGGNLAVFADSENRDAAWKYLQWLSTPETQSAWYEATSDLPAVTAAWETGALATDELLAVFGEQLKTAVAPPAIPNWEQIATVIDTELEKVTKAGLDPAEAAKTIQQQAVAIGTGL